MCLGDRDNEFWDKNKMCVSEKTIQKFRGERKKSNSFDFTEIRRNSITNEHFCRSNGVEVYDPYYKGKAYCTSLDKQLIENCIDFEVNGNYKFPLATN